jgi:hypothetical protein
MADGDGTNSTLTMSGLVLRHDDLLAGVSAANDRALVCHSASNDGMTSTSPYRHQLKKWMPTTDSGRLVATEPVSGSRGVDAGRSSDSTMRPAVGTGSAAVLARQLDDQLSIVGSEMSVVNQKPLPALLLFLGQLPLRVDDDGERARKSPGGAAVPRSSTSRRVGSLTSAIGTHQPQPMTATRCMLSLASSRSATGAPVDRGRKPGRAPCACRARM